MTNDVPAPPAHRAYRFPVSVKGVILKESKVILLKNERDEWELPGSKLELGESAEACVIREIEEELGLSAKLGTLLDTWVYHIREDAVVFIVTYGCYPAPFFRGITHSPEHKDVGLFRLGEINSLRMPEGYKNSIRHWSELLNRGGEINEWND